MILVSARIKHLKILKHAGTRLTLPTPSEAGGGSQRGCVQVILFALGVTVLPDRLGLYGSAVRLG